MKPHWLYPVKRLVTTNKAGEWCQLPYDGHPKGCPKYGNDEKCPPKVKSADNFLDISKPMWLVHSEFDLAIHVAKMEKRHPEWSLKQCRCVLYWQNTSRKRLKECVQEALRMVDADTSTFCPEGMGVNVYATARISGLRLERIRYLSICRHVALIGTSKNNSQLKLFR